MSSNEQFRINISTYLSSIEEYVRKCRSEMEVHLMTTGGEGTPINSAQCSPETTTSNDSRTLSPNSDGLKFGPPLQQEPEKFGTAAVSTVDLARRPESNSSPSPAMEDKSVHLKIRMLLAWRKSLDQTDAQILELDDKQIIKVFEGIYCDEMYPATVIRLSALGSVTEKLILVSEMANSSLLEGQARVGDCARMMRHVVKAYRSNAKFVDEILCDLIKLNISVKKATELLIGTIADLKQLLTQHLFTDEEIDFIMSEIGQDNQAHVIISSLNIKKKRRIRVNTFLKRYHEQRSNLTTEPEDCLQLIEGNDLPNASFYE